MKIFETKEIKLIDEYTVKSEPISSIDLMERAAHGCVSWIIKNIPAELPLLIFTGPGNNGGDGWAIGRLLSDLGYSRIRLFHLQISNIISADADTNRNRLRAQGKIQDIDISSVGDFPAINPQDIVIDALFGSGLSRPLEGLSASLVKHINGAGCRIISVDIPSGLMGEDNKGNTFESIIKADITLTFQFPKRSFFYAENEIYVGKWHVIPIGLRTDIISGKAESIYYTTLADISGKLLKRKAFSHKGTYGNALLIAGSYGMMGAAILGARACMRTGVGLLTSHIPGDGYPIIQAAVPESIYSIDKAGKYFSNSPETDKYSAIGVGPGIGTHVETATAFETLVSNCHKPLVIDADGINILATHRNLLSRLPANTIITPHPGEFDRLTGVSENAFERNSKQVEWSKKYNMIILLKGAYTSITLPNGDCYFNSTGNPGMATAGCGDVLTGMILSLLAQGCIPNEAAILGAFIHGMAGDLAADDCGQQTIIASDIINYIGKAIRKIENYEAFSR